MEVIMNTEMKQLGSRIRADVFEALRELSKQERISMASLTERAILRLLDEHGVEVQRG
jgi:hypothetical protein